MFEVSIEIEWGVSMILGVVSRLCVMLSVTSMVLSGCTSFGTRQPAALNYGSLRAETVNRGENSVKTGAEDSSKVADPNSSAGRAKVARRDVPQGKMGKAPVEDLGRNVEKLEDEIIAAENAKKTQEVARLTKKLTEIVGQQESHRRRMNKIRKKAEWSKKVKSAQLKSGKDLGLVKQLATENVAEARLVRVLDHRLESKLKTSVYGANRDAARLQPGDTSAQIPSRVGMKKISQADAENFAKKHNTEAMDGIFPNRFVNTGNQGLDDLPFQDVEDTRSPLYKKKTALNKNAPNVETKKPDVPNPKSAKGGWDDNYEPNNYRSSAYDLSSYSGRWLSSISGSGYQWDDDWYEIYLNSGARVDVDLRFVHYDGDIDLQLVNSSGSTLASSTGTSDDEYVSYTVSSSGYYYIRVYYDDDGNSYDMKWTTSGGSQQDDDYEPNDSISGSYSLVNDENRWLSSIDGLGVSADDDYYRIEVEPTHRRIVMDLRFDHYSNGGDVEMKLLNSSGSTICSAMSSDDDEYLDCTVPTPGYYYIMVYHAGYCSLTSSTSPCNTYDLRWYAMSTGGNAEDQYEPNDSISEANTSAIPWAGADRTLYNLTQWDEDWFRIPVDSTSRNLRIEADFWDYQGDIDIQLRSPGGTELISSMSTDDDELIQYIVPTQYSYVLLRVFGDNAGNRYSLTVSSEAAEDVYEENDTMSFISTRSNLSNREGTWLSNIQGRARQADDDYYFIGQVPALGRLMIDARFTHSEGDIDIQLVDENGRVVANSIGISNNEYIDTAVRPGLNYVIRVYGDNRGNSYDLKWNSFYDNTRMRAAFSTAYYEPIHSGQGHTATYFDLRGGNGGEMMGLGWYTYHPDFPGAPFWMTADGPVRGNRANMTVRMTRGGVFNDCRADYRQSNGNCSTPILNIGSATLEITGCNTAVFSYDITFPSGGNGTRKIGSQELINFGTDVVDGRNVCTGEVVQNPPANNLLPNTVSMAHEGQWYNPRTSGQGLFLDTIITGVGPKPFFGWYTYMKNPLDVRWWMTMQNIDDARPESIVALSTNSGRGRFDAPPRLDTSDYYNHGEGTVTANGCNSIRVNFPAFELQGMAPLTLDLVRLGPVSYFEYMNGTQYVKRMYCE